MLRKRLVTILMFCDGVLHRTKLFQPDYRYTQSFVDAWSVDEIILLNITRPGQGAKDSFLQVVDNFARRAFVPVTVGGGVRSLEDVRTYMNSGADKVAINTGATDDPALITAIAQHYGSQCVVLSIDAKRSNENSYEVFSKFGTRPTGRTPWEWAAEGAGRGAGEVLLTSIDRDGSLEGYDLDLCRSVSSAVSIPVLVCGGAGSWQHFVDGIEIGGASAVCTANIYHFTDTAIRSAKSFMAREGIAIRPASPDSEPRLLSR